MLPIPVTPTYVGESATFFKRMLPMIEAMPQLFQRLQYLKLDRCYMSLHGLRFVEKLERGATTLSWFDISNDIINIYPMAFRAGNRVDVTLYTGLGLRNWERNVSSTLKHLWTRKLVTSTPSVMDKLSRTFKQGAQSYEFVLNQFSASVEKLQVLHVCNTLIANSIKASDAKMIDIYEYPATKDFVTGNRPYSLTPLISAYRGSNGLSMSQYDYAFAEYCTENGKIRCSEMSVERELIELFEYVSGV